MLDHRTVTEAIFPDDVLDALDHAGLGIHTWNLTENTLNTYGKVNHLPSCRHLICMIIDSSFSKVAHCGGLSIRDRPMPRKAKLPLFFSSVNASKKVAPVFYNRCWPIDMHWVIWYHMLFYLRMPAHCKVLGCDSGRRLYGPVCHICGSCCSEYRFGPELPRSAVANHLRFTATQTTKAETNHWYCYSMHVSNLLMCDISFNLSDFNKAPLS